MEAAGYETVAGSQYLQKKQYPAIGSLQSPVLTEVFSFKNQSGELEFIHILNKSGKHWLVVSTIGCAPGSFNVYDSLHWRQSSATNKVVADVMQCRGKAISLNYVDTQWLSGGSECGGFTIALATALCAGQDPSKVLYHQPSMRSHLMKCINERITPFPERAVCLKVHKASTELIPV